MKNLSTTYVLLGVLALVLTLLAPLLKRKLWVSEALLATAVGVVVGPAVLGWFHPGQFIDQKLLLEHVAKITLAVSLVGVALGLPDRIIWAQRRPLLVMLLIAMPAMWLISGVLAYSILGVGWWSALLLAAVVTPTDPVVASSIVTGEIAEKSVASELRHLIGAESGANDGLAFLLVMFPYLMMKHSTADALREFVLHSLLREVIGGIALGSVVGWLVAKVFRFVMDAHEDEAEQTPLLGIILAMAIGLLGGAELLSIDGILAVFAAGLVFNHFVRGQQKARRERVNEVMKRFFDVPVFLLFGMVVPWAPIFDLGLVGVAFALGVLLLRRLPVVIALRPFLAPVRTNKDAIFMGWFGPVGVAAMVYATWADLHGADGPLWPAASLAILLSIALHGISATPLTRLLPRAHGDAADPS